MKTPTLTRFSTCVSEWRYVAQWPPSLRHWHGHSCDVTYYPARALVEINTSTGRPIRSPRMVEAVWRALAAQ